MKKLNKDLEKILNYDFKNKELLNQSLIHKSYNHLNNNEKLEFLGDRVLGLVISKNLIKLFPDDSEGDLDKKLASLVTKQIKMVDKEMLEQGVERRKLEWLNKTLLYDFK